MNNIKSIRLKSKLSQADLAIAICVRQSTIAMWETGKSNPRSSKLPEIAKVLNCSIDELFC